MSYTDFTWTEAAIRRSGREYVVTLRVTNIGEHVGREVVELYVASPKGPLTKPVRELRAFAKSRELQPGASELVTLRFAVSDLASFDEARSAFVVDGGSYVAELGRSVDDIVTRLPFKAESSVRKVPDVLKPREPLRILEF